jgi:hypothetical protein
MIVTKIIASADNMVTVCVMNALFSALVPSLGIKKSMLAGRPPAKIGKSM